MVAGAPDDDTVAGADCVPPAADGAGVDPADDRPVVGKDPDPDVARARLLPVEPVVFERADGDESAEDGTDDDGPDDDVTDVALLLMT